MLLAARHIIPLGRVSHRVLKPAGQVQSLNHDPDISQSPVCESD